MEPVTSNKMSSMEGWRTYETHLLLEEQRKKRGEKDLFNMS